VGAGLAGLVAAREIARAGRSVAVLEARDRVGGRMFDRPIAGGEVVDLGAEFIGPTQNRIRALVDELGIGTFPSPTAGRNVYYAGGRRVTYADTGLTGAVPPDPALLVDLLLVVPRLDAMARKVPVDAPYTAPGAAQLDAQSLASWLRRNSTGGRRFTDLTTAVVRAIFGADPRELSLLFTLFYIAASGDERNIGTFERNFDTQDGGQMWRFEGGSQLIGQRIAKHLGRKVVLRSPVKRIVQGKNGVRVEYAIVAVPPVLVNQIHWKPHLPDGRLQLGRTMPQGEIWKVAAVYDKPFWRAKGLNGTAVQTGGPVSATFDDSPPNGKHGAVLGFVAGDPARQFRKMSKAARRAAVLKNFADFFGNEALNPITYIETDWPGAKWSRGGPVGIAPPGLLTRFGPALRTPFNRVHWAGTETATYWNGYMDGAVSSGRRAALEVIDRL
jgi:monoamine oxidase